MRGGVNIRCAELILDTRAELGEGPVWDSKTQCLYWVDIVKCKIHIFNPKENSSETIDAPQFVGSIVKHRDGNLVAAMQDGFYYIDLISKKFTLIYKVEENGADIRFNDGKCDCVGRLWAGTMAINQGDKDAVGAGSLYRMDNNHAEKIIEGVTISNGIAWCPDNRVMYYIDTYTKQVVSYDFQAETGEIFNKKTVISIPEEDGLPDGMTIDIEGKLWIAHWGGSKVSRWDPQQGSRLDEIYVPTKNVTCCTFGGENLDELYITTAINGLDESEAEKIGAGGLYRVKLYTKGTQTFSYEK